LIGLAAEALERIGELTRATSSSVFVVSRLENPLCRSIPIALPLPGRDW
jgi:hypothetical protein